MTIPTQSTGIVQNFGKYSRTISPGLSLYIPFIEKVTSVSNASNQHDFTCTAKTKDNIQTNVQVACQVRIEPGDSATAYFKTENPEDQIRAFLDSSVRAQVARFTLDELYENQHEIVKAIFEGGDEMAHSKQLTVEKQLKSRGFTLETVLVRQIMPAAEVASAMNHINAAQRMREAARHEADAKYLTTVREAEADRDRKRLIGEGIALQRKAIFDGYHHSVAAMAESFDVHPREIVEFVLRMQHLDAVESLSRSANAKTVFFSHNPGGSMGGGARGESMGGGGGSVKADATKLRDALLEAQLAAAD